MTGPARELARQQLRQARGCSRSHLLSRTEGSRKATSAPSPQPDCLSADNEALKAGVFSPARKTAN